MQSRAMTMCRSFYWALVVSALCASTSLHAEPTNDGIGFSPTHVFANALGGENIDIVSGNLSLAIPIGPRYELSDRFGYQITLYYNSKLWEFDCVFLAEIPTQSKG